MLYAEVKRPMSARRAFSSHKTRMRGVRRRVSAYTRGPDEVFRRRPGESPKGVLQTPSHNSRRELFQGHVRMNPAMIRSLLFFFSLFPARSRGIQGTTS